MDIIDFSQYRQSRQKSDKRKRTVDAKTKLTNYRTIWNNSPKHSEIEQRALAKIASLADTLEDDDKDKVDYLCIAVDFYDKDDEITTKLFEKLTKMADSVDNTENRLRVYRTLLRSKHADNQIKESIGNIMMDILEKE